MVQENAITVVITTHYVDEAVRVHNLGFIRRGQLLVEATPDYLLKKYNLKSIDLVFNAICERSDKEKSSDTIRGELEVSDICYGRNPVKSRTNKLPRPKDIIKVITHNYYRANLQRNLLFLLGQVSFLVIFKLILKFCLQFAIPSFVFATVFFVFGQFPASKIAVYNGDIGSNLSSIFLDTMNQNDFDLFYFGSEAEAIEAVREKSREVSLALVIERGFERASRIRLKNPFKLSKKIIHSRNLNHTTVLIRFLQNRP